MAKTLTSEVIGKLAESKVTFSKWKASRLSI
jgi:hypothetical protein